MSEMIPLQVLGTFPFDTSLGRKVREVQGLGKQYPLLQIPSFCSSKQLEVLLLLFLNPGLL